MPLGQPLAQARRQQQLLLSVTPKEVLSHHPIVPTDPDDTARFGATVAARRRSRGGTVVLVSRDDWFRGTSWDGRTRETFEAKLARARSGRAEYLRIKGAELTRSTKKPVRRAGRELVRRVLTEHPDDRLQVTMAHADLADVPREVPNVVR
jgi:hypothetical protein